MAVRASVIIPVFNTEPYLPRCLDSVLGQTLTDLEIIVVNDGSTDGSDGVLQRYARLDRRIKVVTHTANLGLHVARISGVLAAAGQSVGYVDSDDYIAPDMLHCMHQRLVNEDADIVRSGAWLLRADAETGAQPVRTGRITFEERTYESGIEYLETDFYPSMCLQLHDRRLWDKALPHLPRLRILGEDNLTSFVLAYFATRVTSLSEPRYFYLERDGTLSGDLSFDNVRRHVIDRYRIVQILRQFVATMGGDRGRNGLEALVTSNKGLLIDYIGGLRRDDERRAAAALYENVWGECLALDRRDA